MAKISTRYARLTPWQARAVLGGLALVVLFCIGVSLSPLASGFADKPSRGPGDVELYRATVERIQSGEGYYTAAGEELRARGYPTRSVFNWRTPLPMWLIGVLPHPLVGKATLCTLAVLALALSFIAMERSSGLAAAGMAAFWLFGALMPCFLGELYVMPVLWAGVLIAISMAAFGLNRPGLGAVAGVAALFFRDLAGPYCVLGLALAVKNRQRKEATIWLAGLAAYVVFFAWHAAQVAALARPHDFAHQQGWVRFGGTAFVISTAQMNALLLVLPQWVAAIYLPLAMAGLAGWSSKWGERIGLTAALYVMLFAVVGQPFNQYWGSLVAPLFCFGAGLAPAAIRDLWHTAHLWANRKRNCSICCERVSASADGSNSIA